MSTMRRLAVLTVTMTGVLALAVGSALAVTSSAAADANHAVNVVSPDMVKTGSTWTMEVDGLGCAVTQFGTPTRTQFMDDEDGAGTWKNTPVKSVFMRYLTGWGQDVGADTFKGKLSKSGAYKGTLSDREIGRHYAAQLVRGRITGC
jgi:hypothetical protein